MSKIIRFRVSDELFNSYRSAVQVGTISAVEMGEEFRGAMTRATLKATPPAGSHQAYAPMSAAEQARAREEGNRLAEAAARCGYLSNGDNEEGLDTISFPISGDVSEAVNTLTDAECVAVAQEAAEQFGRIVLKVKAAGKIS